MSGPSGWPWVNPPCHGRRAGAPRQGGAHQGSDRLLGVSGCCASCLSRDPAGPDQLLPFGAKQTQDQRWSKNRNCSGFYKDCFPGAGRPASSRGDVDSKIPRKTFDLLQTPPSAFLLLAGIFFKKIIQSCFIQHTPTGIMVKLLSQRITSRNPVSE